MRINPGIIVVVASCSQAVEPNTDADVVDSTVESSVTSGCQVVQSLTNSGTPTLLISPQTEIVSEFTRPMFPRFFRSGGWSTAGAFVRDSNGFTLPAVTASTSLLAGWMSLPFESGETLSGISLTVCGDGTTAIVVNPWATQYDGEQPNQTDWPRSIGSSISLGPPSTWSTFDVPTLPITLQSNSTLWLDATVIQLSTATPTPPPNMAISQVVLYVNH